jgi:drug/metabolite transporter (DMT)-like permease
MHHRKLFANPWLQLALSVACVTVSELFLKTGAVETADLGGAWAWTGIFGLVSIWVWIGIVLVILSFITWLYVLRFLPLTIAFPVSQAVHILIPLSSWLILAERITAHRWTGIGLIFAGIMLIAKPVAQMEEKLEEEL